MENKLKQAIQLVIEHGGSISLLQRKMKIGYFEASRLMDEMQKIGVVGPSKYGLTMRDVLIKNINEIDNGNNQEN